MREEATDPTNSVDGELWMVSDTAVAVVTHGAPTDVEIVVVSVARGRQ